MGKKIPASGVGAVRIILKNKEDFHFDLREKEEENGKTRYLYDVFYENATGTFNISCEGDTPVIASLNLSYGKVITLTNDTNLKKLVRYVLDNTK